MQFVPTSELSMKETLPAAAEGLSSGGTKLPSARGCEAQEEMTATNSGGIRRWKVSCTASGTLSGTRAARRAGLALCTYKFAVLGGGNPVETNARPYNCLDIAGESSLGCAEELQRNATPWTGAKTQLDELATES